MSNSKIVINAINDWMMMTILEEKLKFHRVVACNYGKGHSDHSCMFEDDFPTSIALGYSQILPSV